MIAWKLRSTYPERTSAGTASVETSANGELDLRVRGVESLQQRGELHVRCQALQDSEMQTASDDTILRPDRLNPIVQQPETATRMFKKQFSSRCQ